ncbi:hypothetical protein BIW11_07170 [Tropilaelaps mercedesae]|uniref:Uncharacterized protein n=1 Tax=Tropilaelaps mercedesae TaxID=418985 RepID=A0A1V9XV11_9ACAR|nr:hypothetical protein BIW11_07170 [Tropilaelaps mercedesae]
MEAMNARKLCDRMAGLDLNGNKYFLNNDWNKMDPLGDPAGLGLQGPANSTVPGITDNSARTDALLDFSRQAILPPAALAGLTNSPTPAVKPNTGDPMRLWYTVDTDPRTAKKISLDALTYNSIDQSVYIMLQVDCPFPKKFDFINIQDLVFANLRNGMSLMELSDCLRILAKYAKELLKPSRERYKHWNKIPFSKSGVAQKWVRMEGTSPILHQLGYTHETSKGYVFPLTSYGPPLALIKVLALELAMAAAELSVFYNNRHPKAEVITDMLYSTRVPANPNNTELAPETSVNVQSAATGSFNVMDLLSPGLKSIKDTEDPTDEVSNANGNIFDLQRNAGTGDLTSMNSFGYSHATQSSSETETGIPQDFSVNRKRKEQDSSEPTDLTTYRQLRKESGEPSQKPITGRNHNRSRGRGHNTTLQETYNEAQDLSQPRLEGKQGGLHLGCNNERHRQDVIHCSDVQLHHELRHGFQMDLPQSFQELQDFRNSYGQYPRFHPENRLQMQEPVMVSPTALPNLSIFGDMFGNIVPESKE